jgi:O-acetyl-ADP-ribose deacetylase (regulator of RNase III)
MNKLYTKPALLLASMLLLCTSFGTTQALSLYDLEKRPSLKIAGIKILHNGKKIIVGVGDITQIEKVDALVNAANERLLFGSGIAGSIALALGLDGVTETYREIKKKYTRPAAIGSASLTEVPKKNALSDKGFKYIIHAVAPDCRNLDQENDWPQLLSNAYQNTLKATKGKNIESIIIPSLGTGIFGCPEDEALDIMMETLVDSLKHDSELKTLQEVILVVWSGNSDAEAQALEWLSALNTAIYGQDKNYTTLVGTSFNPNTKENILT